MSLKDPVLFISGSMFAQKSKVLIDYINEANKDENCKYLVFKPTNDTRDGLYIHSRVYNKVIPALAWDQRYEEMREIFKYTIAGFALTNPNDRKIIFLDEVHFMYLNDIRYIIQTCLDYNIEVVFAGLETSFKQEYFKVSKYLRDNFSSLFLRGNCNGCGEENAIYNVLYKNGKIVVDGDDIQPGNEEYKVYCQECFNKL